MESMGQLLDLQYKIRKYFAFSPAEIRGMVLVILTFAFIISFRDWGRGDSIDFVFGFFNFFNALLLCTLAVVVHISAQRLWCLATGYRLEWRMWGLGLILGLIVVFLSNGAIWVLLPGGVIVHHLGGHRLGWFRYDINMFAVALIALAGPLASITLAIFFKGISGVIASGLIQKAIALQVAIALYSKLPIPPLDGSRIMYGSRLLFAFSAAGITAMAVLLYLPLSIGLVILFSLLIAVIAWFFFYRFFESKWWTGG